MRASAATHLGAGVCLPPRHHSLVPEDAGVALSQKPRRGRDVAGADAGTCEVWLTCPQIRESGAAGVECVCTECRRCNSTATGLRQCCNGAATALQRSCNSAAECRGSRVYTECSEEGHEDPLAGVTMLPSATFILVYYKQMDTVKKKRVWSRQSILEEWGQVKNRSFTSTNWPDFKKTSAVMNLRIVQGLKDTQECVLFFKSKTQYSGFRPFRTHCTCLPRPNCVGCETRTLLLLILDCDVH